MYCIREMLAKFCSQKRFLQCSIAQKFSGAVMILLPNEGMVPDRIC